MFLVIEHQRRRVLHFGVTEHRTAEWAAQPSLEGLFEQTRLVPAEAFSLPAYHRVGVNYDQGFAPVLPHGCERDPEPAVVRG